MNWVWKMKKRRSILSPYNLIVEIKQVLPLQLGKWHLFTCQRNFKDIIYQKMNVETHYQGNLFTSENTSFTSLPCTETNCKRKENYWRRNDGQNNGEINDIRILNWLQNSLTVIFNTWGFFLISRRKLVRSTSEVEVWLATILTIKNTTTLRLRKLVLYE